MSGYAETPRTKLSLVGPGHLIQVFGEDGELMVDVDLDGSVSFPGGHEPDEVARAFWQALADAGVLAWAAAREP